jgi:hypothetical protein
MNNLELAYNFYSSNFLTLNIYIMNKLFILGISLFSVAFINAQSTITEWNFDADNTVPVVGMGTIINIGGTANTFAGGNPSTGKGYNTNTYPVQSTASGTAGIEIAVSTAGKTNIGITFDHRASGTASRWAQYQYTTNGTSWVVVGNNNAGLSPHDTFGPVQVDLTACTACNNNPNFKFRVVSVFSPNAFCENETSSFVANIAYQRSNTASLATGCVGTGAYSNGGTWRFDNLKVIGNFVLSTETFNQSIFSIYPNPVNSLLNFNKEMSGQIVNINGRVLIKFENVNQINIENLQSGIYFVKNQEGITQKLIVQ